MDKDEAKRKIKQILMKNKENPVQQVVDFLQSNFEVYSWVGIYMVKDNYLHLGAWRGDQATEHTKIPIGKGICGAAAKTGKTEIVSDVHADNRYLSCFISTRSEIVVPIKRNSKTIGEIDIDSDTKNAFTKEDDLFLKEIADMLSEHIHNQ
ncbi:MAG: GAF domain-containing protein [Candidatus Thermoplasmatota archaeon]|nr:GAF domain-containing protein [Candidatus Thermoplasmatota archaeon]MBS3801130.1 GAF domain-containing protein [Candidatus Thermoplasmatota archaeon]